MTAETVARKLGGRRVLKRQVRSDLQLAALVRAGLPVAALEHVVAGLGELGTAGELYGLVGSLRTLQRKRTARQHLSPDESDRLARVARMVVRAEEALGDAERGHRWLGRANRALGGQRPVMLLDSDAGVTAVERELGRLEHGVVS